MAPVVCLQHCCRLLCYQRKCKAADVSTNGKRIYDLLLVILLAIKDYLQPFQSNSNNNLICFFSAIAECLLKLILT